MVAYTEEKARENWCPFARVVILHDGHEIPAANRLFSADASSMIDKVHSPCIASDCMAWRWRPKDGAGNYYSGDWKGYCGLAGGDAP